MQQLGHTGGGGRQVQAVQVQFGSVQVQVPCAGVIPANAPPARATAPVVA
jgi:hypothetical protein